MDREALIGVALFDGRVTGEALPDLELESIFHLLEGLALAVRNIWSYDQMASQSELLTGILRELSNACVVVNHDLQIMHANKSARQYFARSGRRTGELEFSDFPAALGSKIYQVLKTGTAIAPFRFEPPDSPQTVYQISIVPLHPGPGSTSPKSVLLIAEDRTQAHQLQRLEIEAANLRLVRAMADRLAHEIGNALVPLSTHQQLLGEKYRDPEFRASLDHALADGVKRVSRLTNQMRYLARDAVLSTEPLALKPLIEEAYQEAQKHHPQKASKLHYENGNQPLTIAGDRAALKHAMAEVLLNALQATNSEGKIEVSAETVIDPSGSSWVQIVIEDAGAGFTPEAAKRVPEPFYTTRNVGLGLGLTVSRKIIEVHHGRLQIEPPKIGQHGLIRISLPIDSQAKKS
jgi:signal transduction histidine kinase